MAAIFDICGTLRWRTADEVAEPQLCFGEEPILHLDELLLQPAAGQPLDILLGPMPTATGDERDRWLKERERLWKYVALEAVGSPSEDEQGESEKNLRMARKIAITGGDKAGKRMEL